MVSSLLKCHQFDFQPSEAIVHVVPAIFGKSGKIRTISVAAFRVPDLVEILRNVSGHAVTRKLNWETSAQNSRLQSVNGILQVKTNTVCLGASVESSFESKESCAARDAESTSSIRTK